MLKALLKKQFMELYAGFFQNRKTGKSRSKSGMIGYIILYAVLLIIFASTFFFVFTMFADALIPTGLTWVYFALAGLIALLLGVLGDVITSYSSLYRAKDNWLLLSLPIPIRYLMLARLAGVYCTGMLYCSVVYLPALLAFFLAGAPSVLSGVNAVLLWPVLGVLVLVLTCLLGWVVALISGRMKRSSFVTVILSLAFIAAYYYLCANYYEAILGILANIEAVSVGIRTWIYPAYLMGQGAAGNPLHFLLFLLLVSVLLALTVVLLSGTFQKMATQSNAGAKPTGRAIKTEASSVEKTLLRRELLHFASSPIYMLNCGLGVVMLPAAGIAALVLRDRLLTAVASLPIPGEFLIVAAAAVCCLTGSIIDITSPAVSLEGKTIWIAQSIPVEAKKLLDAKRKLHCLFAVPAVVIFTVCAGIALRFSVPEIVMLTAVGVVFAMLMASVGLILNLKNPNLNWTTEAVPVKQSMSVGICLFGGWAIAVLIGVGGWFAVRYLSAYQYLTVCLVVLVLAVRLADRWLAGKGAEIFASL